MKKSIPFFVSVLLVAFLTATMSPFLGLQTKGTAVGIETSSPDMEDCSDSSDLEDSQAENDQDDSKEVNSKSKLGLQKSLLIRWEHQMQLFGEYHITIITPPPQG